MMFSHLKKTFWLEQDWVSLDQTILRGRKEPSMSLICKLTNPPSGPYAAGDNVPPP